MTGLLGGIQLIIFSQLYFNTTTIIVEIICEVNEITLMLNSPTLMKYDMIEQTNIFVCFKDLLTKSFGWNEFWLVWKLRLCGSVNPTNLTQNSFDHVEFWAEPEHKLRYEEKVWGKAWAYMGWFVARKLLVVFFF